MSRGTAARWVAPFVFLLAVTGVVLLVRAGLRSSGEPAPAPAPAVVRSKKPAASAPVVASVPKQYYVIQSGDTLDAIAVRFGTTVDDLLAMNPGTEPTALHPGERIRVK